MLVMLAHVSGALGLFFMGARLLTQHLKALNSHRFRLGAARWTRTRWMGLAWGLIAGAVMQSTVVLSLVVVGMVKSDLVTSKRAFPILLGGNVGVILLILVVMLDVKLMALYGLGIAYLLTLIMPHGRMSAWRAMPTACFGLGMILVGSLMLKESVIPLANHPWFQQTMLWMGGSLFLPLLSGLVLTVVLQSGAPAVVSGICMAAGGFIGIAHVIMIFCGACLGGSLILYLLTLDVRGRARQVVMYQVLHNVVLNVIFVPLIWIEAQWEVPLLSAGVRASGVPLEQGLALSLIVIEGVSSIVRLTALDVAVRLVERWWPPTELEALAKPRFIEAAHLDDARTALRLVDLEQRRLLEMMSRYLDTVRSGAEPSELRETTQVLLGRIDGFLGELAAHCRDCEADAHHSVLTRHKFFIRLEKQVLQMCDELHGLGSESPLATWSLVLVEGIDVLMLELIDAAASDDAAAWPSIMRLMGDRSELLRTLRDTALKNQATLSAGERAKVVRLANVAEHVFLLTAQLAREYREASSTGETFLDHTGSEGAASVRGPVATQAS